MSDTVNGPASAAAADVIVLRPWTGLVEVPGMVAANNRLRRHIGHLQPVDEPGMAHRYTTLVNSDPLTDCVVAERHGITVGYARVEWQDWRSGERVHDLTLVAEPSTWGTGLADRLIAWCEARAAVVAAANPTDRPQQILAFELSGDPETTRALVDAGFVAVRTFAEMLCDDLTGAVAPVVPDGYTLRPPEPDELPAVWETLLLAFEEHWGEREADEWDPETWWGDPRFRRDLVTVAWTAPADGSPATPAATVSAQLDIESDGPQRGVLSAVVTHPGHRRRGLGEAVIRGSVLALREAGADQAYLDVDTDNATGALRLYERCGFRVTSESRAYAKPLPATGTGSTA